MSSALSLQLQISQVNSCARRDYCFWRDLIEPLLSLGKGSGQAIEKIAKETGLPKKTITRKFYLARNHGLAALINKSLAGPEHWATKKPVGLSRADRELVKIYCEGNQRGSEAGLKKLRSDWVKGRVKTETEIDPRTRMPRGWSLRNLRHHAPTALELKAIRIGRSAASSERRLTYTTRKGLWVGSHYMFDDMWHDHFVNSFAENQAGRPLELFSHDLFSARKVRWGIRVRTRKDDGSYNALAENMTRMILAATLYLDGYSARGTVICAEKGTAAIRTGIERHLHDMSLVDGRPLITVQRNGMDGASTHAGHYEGVSKGNPRFKASLESSNNLTHNKFADLPGQTGRSLETRPEQLHGLLKHNGALLAARAMRPEIAELLQFPLLELNQFLLVAQEYYGEIENDPEHDLEGWDLNSINELLIGGQWIDQRKLLADPAQAQLALALIASGGLQTRPRKMSRREVWDAGAHDLIRIPGYGVCAILGDDLAKERRVRSNMFEFQDAEVGPGDHRFEAIAKAPNGELIRLQDRETYETFVNPFAPDMLFVRRADGRYIGECPRILTPCRGDHDAWARAAGAAAKEEAALLRPLRLRHAGEVREKAEMHENNVRALGGKDVRARADHGPRISDEEIAEALQNDRGPDLEDRVPDEEISSLFQS